MSKQSEAKAQQGWKRKPNQCGECRHFHFSSEKLARWAGDTYVSEFNLRCSLGGFKVIRSNVCGMFQQRNPS